MYYAVLVFTVQYVSALHLAVSLQVPDFIALDSSGKPQACLQVCQEISSATTLVREIEPLLAAAKYFGSSDNYVITLNQEKEYSEGKTRVCVVPAFKWLLAN